MRVVVAMLALGCSEPTPDELRPPPGVSLIGLAQHDLGEHGLVSTMLNGQPAVIVDMRAALAPHASHVATLVQRGGALEVAAVGPFDPNDALVAVVQHPMQPDAVLTARASGLLRALDAHGTELSSWQLDQPIEAMVALPDPTALEWVVATPWRSVSEPERLQRLASDGREIWRQDLSHSGSILAGQINADGVPDLLTGAGVVVDGRYGTVLANLGPASAFALGDVDGDGLDEAAVARVDRVEIWGLDPAELLWTHPRTAPVRSVLLADVNGDGLADLVTGEADGADELLVAADALTGATHWQERTPGPLSSYGLAWMDLAGDSSPDLVVGDDRLRAITPGGPTVAAPLELGPVVGPVLADLRGTGRPSLWFAHGIAEGARVREHDPDTLQLLRSVDIPGTSGPHAVAIGRVAGDGRVDLVVSTAQGAHAVYQGGAGALRTHPLPGVPGGIEVVADVMPSPGHELVSRDGSEVSVWTTGGEQVWTSPFLLGEVTDLEASQLDRERHAELAVTSDFGVTWVLGPSRDRVEALQFTPGGRLASWPLAGPDLVLSLQGDSLRALRLGDSELVEVAARLVTPASNLHPLPGIGIVLETASGLVMYDPATQAEQMLEGPVPGTTGTVLAAPGGQLLVGAPHVVTVVTR